MILHGAHPRSDTYPDAGFRVYKGQLVLCVKGPGGLDDIVQIRMGWLKTEHRFGVAFVCE